MLPSDLSLYTKFRTQLSDAPLISNEQISIGGFDSVRGYLESEQLADYGAVANFELRSPSLFNDLSEALKNFQVFAFYDWSYSKIHNELPGQDDTFDLQGLGAGVRFNVFDPISVNLLWARPLNDTNNTEADDNRVHISVRYEQ